MSLWRQFWFLIILALATCQRVQAQTCAPGPDNTIVCGREGFDRAVKKCSDGIGDAAACKIKLDAALKSWDDLKARHAAFVASIPPPASPAKAVTGYFTGLVGLGAIVLAPGIEGSDRVRWSVGIGGALMVATGLWAVLP